MTQKPSKKIRATWVASSPQSSKGTIIVTMLKKHRQCRQFATLFFVLVAVPFISACKGSRSGGSSNSQPPKEYQVVAVTPEKATINTDYPATLRGKLDVEIRPQVSGQIVRLAVDEGAEVHKGQLLFEIDPVQYREQYNVAEAAVRVAESKVATARLTAENNRLLAKEQVIGPYALQTAENDLLTAEAALAQAKAQLVAAQQNLSFTRVVSPTDGVVGSIPFRVGSLVSPSMVQPLTTVSNISEMYAHISLSERELLQMTEEGKSTEKALDLFPPVKLTLLDGSDYPHQGKIATLSGVIDPQTGTINVRILFPNPERLLRSGSSGSVKLSSVLDGVFKISSKSIYTIQERTFVYVVDAKNIIHSREVKTIDQTDGASVLVTEGLEAGERIAADGIITLREGMTIVPVEADKSSAPSSETPAR